MNIHNSVSHTNINIDNNCIVLEDNDPYFRNILTENDIYYEIHNNHIYFNIKQLLFALLSKQGS
jgi:hypothetical protein